MAGIPISQLSPASDNTVDATDLIPAARPNVGTIRIPGAAFINNITNASGGAPLANAQTYNVNSGYNTTIKSLCSIGGIVLQTTTNNVTVDGSYLLSLINTLSTNINTLSSNMSAPYTSQTLVLSANSFSTTVIKNGACVLGDLSLISMGYGANDNDQNVLVRLYDLAASQVGSVTVDTVPVAETVFNAFVGTGKLYAAFSIPEGGVTCNNGLIIAAYGWYSYTQRVAGNANYNGAGAFGSPTNAQYKAVNSLKATVNFR